MRLSLPSNKDLDSRLDERSVLPASPFRGSPNAVRTQFFGTCPVYCSLLVLTQYCLPFASCVCLVAVFCHLHRICFIGFGLVQLLHVLRCSTVALRLLHLAVGSRKLAFWSLWEFLRFITLYLWLGIRHRPA